MKFLEAAVARAVLAAGGGTRHGTCSDGRGRPGDSLPSVSAAAQAHRPLFARGALVWHQFGGRPLFVTEAVMGAG